MDNGIAKTARRGHACVRNSISGIMIDADLIAHFV
jgi:hypothetical protein